MGPTIFLHLLPDHANMDRLTKYYTTILTLLLVCVSAGVQAQGGPPVGGTPPCWPPPCIPIDGGMGLLLLAGAAFGAKKLVDRKSSVDN